MPARKTKSKPRAVRTVSVPAALDKQMRMADDVNWSAVAVAAFERELQAVEERKTYMTERDAELHKAAEAVLDRVTSDERFKQSPNDSPSDRVMCVPVREILDLLPADIDVWDFRQLHEFAVEMEHRYKRAATGSIGRSSARPAR